MTLSEFTPILIPFIVATALFFLQSTIKELISRYFSNLTKKEINLAFIFLLITSIAIAIPLGNLANINPKEEEEEKEEQEIAQQKSDAEVALDAGKYLMETVTDKVNNKKKKDSILIAHKKPLWVFQIGLPQKREDAWNLYLKLKEIPGICFFKKSKKTYLIIKKGNYKTEDEINMAMDGFKTLIQETGEDIDIINLAAYCDKKEEVKEDEKLKNKKEGLEAKCYICE